MAARPPRLTLQADTVEDLMSENPISLRESADVREAIALMIDRGYSAAPVIDDGGRAIGVLSVTDILTHDRESAGHPNSSGVNVVANQRFEDGPADDSGVTVASRTTVGDIMTPGVFTIRTDTTVAAGIQSMISYRVHHLFVTDGDGVLIGVISTGDILRKLG